MRAFGLLPTAANVRLWGDPHLFPTAHPSSDSCNIFSRNALCHEDRYP
jgi:hypothetical protein